MTRYFRRLPAALDVDAAVALAEAISMHPPRLHDCCHGNLIAGSVEVVADAAAQLEERAALLAALAESWRP